jgi:hypothetical protein
MVLIGDYSWVLTAVFLTLGVLIACYFTGLFVWSRYNRTRSAPESESRKSARPPGGGREAIQTR